jgi:N-acetylneuraminic acid mutarotase
MAATDTIQNPLPKRRGSSFLAAFTFSVLAFGLACPASKAQATAPNEWTWYGGTTLFDTGTVDGPVNGTMGTPSPSNTPGGRTSAATWTDKSGNLWLFSGVPYQGYYNDLWMLNPATGEWTWVRGNNDAVTGIVASAFAGVYGTVGTAFAANTPGGRQGAVTWVDTAGHLWMFGGYGLDSANQAGYLNDLWEFSSSTNQWTWMGGSSAVTCTQANYAVQCGEAGVYGAQGTAATANVPGSREYAVSWTDGSGNFWLFGGYGYDSKGTLSNLNDLWEFNPTTNAWTWVSGSSTVNDPNGQPGVYGVLGTPAGSNAPGARKQAVGWTDAKGNMWLFGGYGVDSADAVGELNDFWMLNPASGEWTWMAGANNFGGLQGIPGAYTGWMTPASGNAPGGRQSSTSWTDSAGNFWLYGGFGVDSAGVVGELDDFWEFNPVSNQWAWMGGNSTFVPHSNGSIGQSAVYGTLQTPNLANWPGGLGNASGWTDKNGNLWLYGGYGFDVNGSQADFNDLWVYQTSAPSLPVTATPSLSMNTGTYAAGQTLTISDTTPGATIAYFIAGSVAPTPYTGPITISSSLSIDAVAAASGHATSAVATATYSLPGTASPAFSLAPGTYRSAQTVTLADTTPGVTIYYTFNGVPTTASNVYTGPIAISASETVEAMAVANGYANSAVATADYTIWPVSAANEWAWVGGLSTGAAIQQYGVRGTPAIGNIPAERDHATSWTDHSGNFWLFGGNRAYGGRNDLWRFNPSTQQWAWMNGSIAFNCSDRAASIDTCSESNPGVYGILGTAAAENIPGGRVSASSWVDNNGNFWIFGGQGLDANSTSGVTVLNDLWRFNPSTNQWTWMSGSNNVSNNCFTDFGVYCAMPSVYGTLGIPAAGNTPGSRQNAITWTDNKGNLWLFGGSSYDVPNGVEYYFNELWEFNPVTNLWAWMGGSSARDGSSCEFDPSLGFSICGEPGISGTIATPSAGNLPGGRAASTSWIDQSGNLWLFSGNGFDVNGNLGDPNDVWQFNPSTLQWAWMGGNDTVPGCDLYQCSYPGTQGTQGTPAAGNTPSGVDHAAGWVDKKGDFWLYDGSYNMWEFNPSANEWAWMGAGGSTSVQDGSVYGTLGVPAPGNGPGLRTAPASWTDSAGNFWLFGGENAFSPNLYENDLWQYVPSAPAPVAGFAVVDLNNQLFNQVTSFQVQAGTSGTSTVNTVVADGFNSAVALSAGGLPSGITASLSPSLLAGFGTSQVTVSVGLDVPPGDYTFPVTGTSGGVTENTTVALQVISAPPPNFTLGTSPPSLTINSGSSGTVKLTVTPLYGFGSAVSLTCSDPALGITCSLSPATLTPSGAAASTVMTLSASSQSAAMRPTPHPFLPYAVLALGLCFAVRKKRRITQQLLLVAAIAALGQILGCGGAGAGGGSGSGSGGSGTTPVTSTVTITAMSASVVQTTTVSLTVN